MNTGDEYCSKIDELDRSRNIFELDECLWNDKCDYIELETCHNLNPNRYNLLTLQLNIRSILGHLYELKHLLHELDKKNTPIDVILLCETFLTEKTMSMVNISSYTHIGNCWCGKKGGGVSILLKEGITYKRRKDLDVYDEGRKP